MFFKSCTSLGGTDYEDTNSLLAELDENESHNRSGNFEFENMDNSFGEKEKKNYDLEEADLDDKKFMTPNADFKEINFDNINIKDKSPTKSDSLV